MLSLVLALRIYHDASAVSCLEFVDRIAAEYFVPPPWLIASSATCVRGGQDQGWLGTPPALDGFVFGALSSFPMTLLCDRDTA